ncbi:granzyme B [Amia ocellicauda]|uniref:granzyme B n=1 Tax=Amia ocellicauda TaxID=2972642 RepID=UPI003463A31C
MGHSLFSCNMMVLCVSGIWALLLYFAGATQIIGGHDETPHSRPYEAFLLVKRGQGSFNCGGSLIREDFILTAAHCNGNNITAILGAQNVNDNENSQQIIKVVKKFPFPSYCRKGLNDDIMLLKLERNASLNSQVGIAPLPQEEHKVKVGSSCWLAGWGATDPDGYNSSSTLKAVELTVVRDLCKQNWRRQFNEFKICASRPMAGGCKGDSGAPLVCKGVVEGVLSSGGMPCGFYPSMFTRVSVYLDWIAGILVNN